MPRVSIIIPLFNQKEFVAEAIESSLDQTISDVEVIVVDDGSTDSPGQILDRFGKKIKVVEQQNQGLASARNAGLGCASGEYIQFLDADDYLHREKIAHQIRSLTESGARVAYCEIAQHDMSSRKLYLRYVGEIEELFPHLYNVWHTYPLPIHSLLFHRSIIETHGGFEVDLQAAEDRYYLSLLTLKRVPFVYYPFIGGGRRLHGSNMNKDRLHIYCNMIKFYQRINSNPLAIDYFEKKVDCTSLMNANLTFMFLHDIESSIPLAILRKIKDHLNREGVQFTYEYFPMPDVPFKRILLPALSVSRRLRRNVRKALAGVAS
jgi:glycosyltransferase involved in cell wall biosynthesis